MAKTTYRVPELGLQVMNAGKAYWPGDVFEAEPTREFDRMVHNGALLVDEDAKPQSGRGRRRPGKAG